MEKESDFYKLDILDAKQEAKVSRMWLMLYILVLLTAISFVGWPMYHDAHHPPARSEVVVQNDEVTEVEK